jgi:hypothetical protein
MESSSSTLHKNEKFDECELCSFSCTQILDDRLCDVQQCIDERHDDKMNFVKFYAACFMEIRQNLFNDFL